ncbi:MAG TPA: hypothetical protein VIH47_04730 [Solirubrobacterales bacterium]
MALLAVTGCGSSKTHGEEGTLTLTEPGGNSGGFAPIGRVGKEGFSPGNGAAIWSSLLNAAKKPVGELHAICIDTQKPPSPNSLSGTCTGTVVAPGGTFALSAGGKEVLGASGVTGAITGGTGKYNGAVGTFTSKSTSSNENGPSKFTLDYILP